MSEQNPENGPESVSETPSTPSEGKETEKASEAVTDDPETFPRAYVEQLRRENAEARVGAKKSDALAARLVTVLAGSTGKLADPSDLPYSDDLLDEDGMPDETKVLAAVDELLTRKPHLAATRPVGDVGQGARGETAGMMSLAELLRAGAG